MKPTSHRGFAPLLILVIVAAVIAGSVFVVVKHNNPSKIENKTSVSNSTTTPSTTITNQTTEATPPSTKTPQPKKVVTELPHQGDVFTLGDTILIQWDPSKINVSTMYLQRTSRTLSGVTGLQIYKRTYLEDPVSKNGSFYYKLPKDYSLEPGSYQVELDSYGESQKILMKNVFVVKAPVGANAQSEKPFYINTVSGEASSYAPTSIMNLTVDAREGDGTPATEANGFMVEARIYNSNRTIAIATSASWKYDPVTQTWLIQTAIPEQLGTFDLEVSLYCGRVGPDSVCAQKYGTSLTSRKEMSVTISH